MKRLSKPHPVEAIPVCDTDRSKPMLDIGLAAFSMVLSGMSWARARSDDCVDCNQLAMSVLLGLVGIAALSSSIYGWHARRTCNRAIRERERFWRLPKAERDAILRRRVHAYRDELAHCPQAIARWRRERDLERKARLFDALDPRCRESLRSCDAELSAWSKEIDLDRKRQLYERLPSHCRARLDEATSP
jgi:hypothetical protein